MLAQRLSSAIACDVEVALIHQSGRSDGRFTQSSRLEYSDSRP